MRISDWSSDVCSSDLQVLDLVAGIGPTLPVILTPHDSYETARIVASTRGVLGRGTQRKIDTALNVFEQHIDGTALLSHLDVPRSEVVTPLMFESELFEIGRASCKERGCQYV